MSFTKKLQEAAITSSQSSVMTLSLRNEEPVMAAYSPDEWTKVTDRYLWYDDFDDESVSTIDVQKNITLDGNQINLSQEELSQFIPFEMSRRYDNFDMALNTRIQFHYVNEDGEEDYVSAVNVKYNDDKLRFALLVPANMTVKAGKIKFEIIATGTNSKGENYKWISRTCDKLNVIASLSGNGIIDPTTSDWYTQFVRDMDAKILDAQTHAINAQLYANEAANSAASVDEKIATAGTLLKQEVLTQIGEDYYTKETVETRLTEVVTEELLKYYTKDEVDKLFEDFDISDQLVDITNRVTTLETEFESFDGLAALSIQYDGVNTLSFYNGENLIESFVLNTNPSSEWVTAYDLKVDNKISEAINPVQNDLNLYKTQTDADLQSIHNNIDNLPSTLESDYYTKTKTDELLNLKANKTDLQTIETTANTNKSDIGTLGTKVAELSDAITNMDKSPSLVYDITYEDDKLTLLEGASTDELSAKTTVTITGGSGGGTSSALKLEYITKTPLIATVNDQVLISYRYSGTDSSGDDVGDGTATWKVAGIVVATETITTGENTFDITKYLSLGTQKVQLSVTDDAGSLVTKSWTVQKIDVRIESTFNDKLTYPIGTIAFDYTPYGAISKDVHFILDGKEVGKVTTSASGIPMGYTLPSQTHGAHLLEVYMTAEVNNNPIESNHIVKDVIWYDATSTIPVIGTVYQEFTALQYDTTNITYTVYDPTTETPEVTLAVDGNVVSTLTLDSNTQTWQFKSSEIGDHVLTITCGDTVKTINATVEKLDIEVEPVTAGLVIDFNPVGKSNSDTDRIWSNDNYAMTVSDNFDWVNGGYQIDGNGDQYFCIKAGTSIELDYHMFADDAKRNGKEMKLIFKTTNVQEANAQFMSCIDNTTGSDHIGIEMFAHEAFIYGSADKLNLKYSEDDIIEFEFNITKDTESVSEICGYEDGVSTRHLVYDDSFNFTQSTPKVISLGSEKCDLHIYRLKIYNTSLTDRGVLSNFIADARSAEEMINRYRRNQIYNENQELTPEILAEKCPWLRVYVVSAPYFTNKKSDKVPYTTIRQIYKNGDPILDNWTCYDAQHSGRTSTCPLHMETYA